MEGSDLSSVMSKTWRSLAASESRLNLMCELLKYGVGFAEIEEFNLDLQCKFRSRDFKENYGERNDKKLIKAAMEIKIRDERKFNNEVNRDRNILRKKLEEIYDKNSKPYRAKIKSLRCESAKVKNELNRKYEKKLSHLRAKYRDSEDDKIRKVPKSLEEFSDLSIFSPRKYNEIETERYDVEIIGNIILTEGERAILRLHPKFSIMTKLVEGGIQFRNSLC